MTYDELRPLVDEFVCMLTPGALIGIGSGALIGIGYWYDQFPQLSDDELRALLAQAWQVDDGQPHEPRTMPYG